MNHQEFQYFQRLHTEIRLLIWEFHFAARRIHILYPSETSECDTACILLAHKTLDAVTKRLVSGRIRSDINREARRVASKSTSRERIYSFCAPLPIESLFRPTAQSRYGEPAANREPLDIDWSADLIYICSPESIMPFMSLARRPWAGKIQNLALAIPWTSLDPRTKQTRLAFECELLPDAMKSLSGIKSVTVISLPQRPGGNEPAEAKSGLSRLNCQRDLYGFMPLTVYTEQGLMPGELLSLMDDTRIKLALTTKFNRYGAKANVTITRGVDIDLVFDCSCI